MQKLYRMLTGRSWITANNVKFTREHPFQLVNEEDAAALMREKNFREAYADELRQFYGVDINE